MPVRAGRDALFEVLASEGVRHIFGNPGTTELPLIDGLVDHLFRHRGGQMVAMLTRIFGPENLPLAEEVVRVFRPAAVLQKPFHLNMLLTTLRRILRSQAAI